MSHSKKRPRGAQRFPLELPLEICWKGSSGRTVRQLGTIRDISTRGIYFLIEQNPPAGSEPELVVRLPVEGAPGGGPVLRCSARVVRIEPQSGKKVGVAARIENYQFDLAPPRRQRRSPRLLWRVKLVIAWEDADGLACRQPAETEVVNAHGGLIRLGTGVPPRDEVEIVRPQTNETRRARVVWHEQIPGGLEVRLGVELESPSESFWGLRIPSRSGTLF